MLVKDSDRQGAHCLTRCQSDVISHAVQKQQRTQSKQFALTMDRAAKAIILHTRLSAAYRRIAMSTLKPSKRMLREGCCARVKAKIASKAKENRD